MNNRVVLTIAPQATTQGARIAAAKAFNLVLFGLNVPAMDLAALKFPQSPVVINYHFIGGTDWNGDTAHSEFKQWVLTNAFRDLAEAVNALLESVYGIVLPVRLGEQVSRDGVLTATAWGSKNGELVSKKTKFAKGGLTDKVKALHDLGFHLQDAFVDGALSIQATRNCLAHRQGIVSAEDAKPNTALTVRYKRRFPVAIVGGREEEITSFPYQTSATEDTQLFMRDDDASKSFAVGERISFDAAEFDGICWTLHRMADHLESRIVEYCQQHGRQFVGFADEPPNLMTSGISMSSPDKEK